MKLRQARKIIARGVTLTPQEVPWKASTLDKAVDAFMRWIRRGHR